MIRRFPHPPSRLPCLGGSGYILGLAGLVFILIVSAAAAGSGTAEALTIDDFTTGQATQTLTFPPAATSAAASVSGSGILGGERDIEVSLTSGTTAGDSIGSGVSGGMFSQSQDASIMGSSRIVWDGTDGASAVNPIGLGSIDLTAGGSQDALVIQLGSSDTTFTVMIEVWTDAGNASSLSVQLQGPVASPTSFTLPYVSFSTTLGTGADFTHVGAISFTVVGNGALHMALDRVATTATIAGSKTVALDKDLNGDGLANPGDTLRYTVVLAYMNSLVVELQGRAATVVTYTNTPPANTTLVVGSVTTSQGSVTMGNNNGDTSVAVAVGTLNLFPAVTIQFSVTINNPLPPGVTQVVCQGTSASNTLTGALTDDPGLPGDSDPTITPVFLLPGTIPTLGEWGFFALAFALAGLGLKRLRRPRTEIVPTRA
jgi:hypothetical protein